MIHVQQSSLTSSIHKRIKGQERSEPLKEKNIEHQAHELRILEVSRTFPLGKSIMTILQALIFLVTIHALLLSHNLCGLSLILTAQAEEPQGDQLSESQCPDGAALLSVISDEYGATLWVDETRLGRLPISAFCIKPGFHLLQLIRITRERGQSTRRSHRRLFWLPSCDRAELNLGQIEWEVLSVKTDHTLTSHNELQAGQEFSRDSVKSMPHVRLLKLETRLSNEQIYFDRVSMGDGPHHGNLVSAFRVRLAEDTMKLNQRSAAWRQPLLHFDVLSYQDLFEGALPLHPLAPWRGQGAQLNVRELNIGTQINGLLSLDKSGLYVGRLFLNEFSTHTSRTWSLDGVHASTAMNSNGWSFEPNILFGLESSERLITWRNLYGQFPQRELWLRGGAKLNHQTDLYSLKLDFSYLEAVSRQLDGDNKDADIDAGLSSSLLSTSITLSSKDYEGAFSLSVSDNEDLSSLHLFMSAIKQKRERGRLRLTYKAGDRWDQRWLPGEVDPLVYTAPLLHVDSEVSLRSINYRLSYMTGQPPRWSRQLSDNSAQGESLRVSIGTGPTLSRSLLNLTDVSLSKASTSNGPMLSLTQYVMRGGARRWLIAPWLGESLSGPSRLTVLSAGWFINLGDMLRSGLTLSAQMSTLLSSSHQVGFASHTQKGDVYLWPELELTWVFERVGFSGYCGHPLEVEGVLAPNLWRVSCGISVELLAPLKL